LLRLGGGGLRLVLIGLLGVEARGERGDLRPQRPHFRFERGGVTWPRLEGHRQSEQGDAGHQGETNLREGHRLVFLIGVERRFTMAHESRRTKARRPHRRPGRAHPDGIVRGDARRSGAQRRIVRQRLRRRRQDLRDQKEVRRG
jgi:hypothetical protein